MRVYCEHFCLQSLLSFAWFELIHYNTPSLYRSGMYTVPGNAKVHYNYANLLKDMGRTDEAILYYRNTLS